MEIMKGIARLIVFLMILSFFIGILKVFGFPGLIVSVTFSFLATIYHQQRKLMRMIEKLDEKIQKIKG